MWGDATEFGNHDKEVEESNEDSGNSDDDSHVAAHNTNECDSFIAEDDSESHAVSCCDALLSDGEACTQDWPDEFHLNF